MLNFGFWSSLKGMVKVPNLSGLTRTTATQSIVDNGLVAVETGSTTTADDTLNQKIASQTPPLDTLVDYETNVSYTYYLFSFTPYSFTPYSFTPQAYSFTPYSFTPQAYSFTPQVYSFTPYSFTPQAAQTGVWYTYCGSVSAGYNPGTSIGPEFWPGKTCAQVQQLLTQTGEIGSGFDCLEGPEAGPSPIPAASCSAPYSFTPAVYSFTPYSFTPQAYSFTPTAASGVWYAYCASSGAGGGSQGPDFWANKTCAQVQQFLTQAGELGSNFTCAAGTEGGTPTVTAPSCGAPYSFTPTAYSFTPYSFTPVYSFTPYSFTPVYSFTPYSFTPQAYSFTPQAYSFTPVAPYSFTPVAYSFVPLKICIDQDTLVQVVGLEDSIEFKAAKDIKLGDQIWSITWEGLLDDLQDPSASTVYPENLQGVQRVKSQIVQIDPSVKDTTIYFNGDKTKRFTAEEKVLIKRLDSHIFVEAKTVTENDFIFEATDSGMVATPVTGIEYIEETRNVFKFNAFPVDTIIAGNMVVHNSKI